MKLYTITFVNDDWCSIICFNGIHAYTNIEDARICFYNQFQIEFDIYRDDITDYSEYELNFYYIDGLEHITVHHNKELYFTLYISQIVVK